MTGGSNWADEVEEVSRWLRRRMRIQVARRCCFLLIIDGHDRRRRRRSGSAHQGLEKTRV